ncbi:MAG: hypothetical protein DMG22_11390 [Acidobacteria bacterium]|nr:MAG: hypothetical protein DMG22_11390 [Acidobacteriota bacterium]
MRSAITGAWLSEISVDGFDSCGVGPHNKDPSHAVAADDHTAIRGEAFLMNSLTRYNEFGRQLRVSGRIGASLRG